MNKSRSEAAKKGWQRRRDRTTSTSWNLYKPKPEHSPEAIEVVLNERGKTHGDFSENARVMQGMKRVARTGDNWLAFLAGVDSNLDTKLVDVQAEAIEMIIVKLGRIVTGNPDEEDHWRDIIGYAQLALDRLPRGRI